MNAKELAEMVLQLEAAIEGAGHDRAFLASVATELASRGFDNTAPLVTLINIASVKAMETKLYGY